MSNPYVCGAIREIDGAKCVVAPHPTIESHAFIRDIDKRLFLLDDLAETFKKAENWEAYHHVRAVAHDLNFHLSSCVEGLRELVPALAGRRS